jgi:outer membrane protein assembly factor BamB
VIYKATWNGNKGSIIYADGMLYCYDEATGDVGLVPASPKGFEVVSSFRVTQGSGKHWAHPAISGGRLYIRHGDALMAYDIKAR